MATASELIREMKTGNKDSILVGLYGEDQDVIGNQRERYIDLLKSFENSFGDAEVSMFSSPGRTEIGGNHTDHNQGKVLAASIDLDCIGIASKTNTSRIVIIDLMHNQEVEIDITKTEKVDGENSTVALVKGIVEGFKRNGYKIGGFNLSETSNVISAAGVSSSASFEMLLTTIINAFYNGGDIEVSNLAKIGQFAENAYWDKQSGLLDQMSCGVGGMIAIDFENAERPVVEKVEFDFSSQKYKVLIVNTGGNHANLSEEYSSIPKEMKMVAQTLGVKVLRETSRDKILQNMSTLRKKAGDRPILRALHFFEDSKRVDEQVMALRENRFDLFLKLINDSGNSSWKWLQNCYSTRTEGEQGVALALALTEMFITETGKGACRVHGGGFAGVIVAYLPEDLADEYSEYMEATFGKQCVFTMNIRSVGSICL